MRATVTAFLAATLVLAPVTGWAGPKNPYLMKPGKSLGMVIIALDDTDMPQDVPDNATARAALDDYRLGVAWFDGVRKRPHLELHWVNSPNGTDFTRVADDKGRRYLISPIGQGDALIMSYYVQGRWGMCYNTETVRFFIKADTYNLIGRFNPIPARAAIETAVSTGAMPASVQQSAAVAPLTGHKLDGFVPASSISEDDRKALADLVARNVGHAVEVLTPALTTTDYNLSKNMYGQPSCAFWASRKNRPDRDKPMDEAAPAQPAKPEE